jgi:hypothetical protein
MVWGKPETGAWANAVEEEEQEHGKYIFSMPVM